MTMPATSLLSLLADAPVDIGRDEARELAERELAQKVYVDAEPSWWERASTWAWDHFNELLQKASGAVGGIGWLLVLVLVVVAIIIVIAGRPGRSNDGIGAASRLVFGEQVMSAAEHRSQAELAAQEAALGHRRHGGVPRTRPSARGALHPRSPTGADRRRGRSRSRRVLPQPCAGVGSRSHLRRSRLQRPDQELPTGIGRCARSTRHCALPAGGPGDEQTLASVGLGGACLLVGSPLQQHSHHRR